MPEGGPPEDGPPVAAFDGVFAVDRVETDENRLIYRGRPLASERVVERHVWPIFRQAGYEVRLATVPIKDPITGITTDTSQALVAEPRSVGIDGIPWTNVITAFLTVVTTLWAGAQWYQDSIGGPLDLLSGWPFTISVLTVLGVHELGHYVMSRYHGVEASLPYFIPIPSFIGTMGAVIRMRGRMPNRKALFDIGVAGPLAGLAATAVITTVGLTLQPVSPPSIGLSSFEVNYPPLVTILASVAGRSLGTSSSTAFANPVVFAGWVGMFVTFLNLLPVGQLDGGHILRAMAGERQETIAAVVPALLFGLAAYLYYALDSSFNAVFLWVFWGLFAIGLAYAGPATPIQDDSLDTKRVLVGLGTFVLGILCFTPIPLELVA
jgi:membrane-associated protease RseP (regulator of RpoE activity)